MRRGHGARKKICPCGSGDRAQRGPAPSNNPEIPFDRNATRARKANLKKLCTKPGRTTRRAFCIGFATVSGSPLSWRAPQKNGSDAMTPSSSQAVLMAMHGPGFPVISLLFPVISLSFPTDLPILRAFLAYFAFLGPPFTGIYRERPLGVNPSE
jgi:hypothetical protein